MGRFKGGAIRQHQWQKPTHQMVNLESMSLNTKGLSTNRVSQRSELCLLTARGHPQDVSSNLRYLNIHLAVNMRNYKLGNNA